MTTRRSFIKQSSFFSVAAFADPSFLLKSKSKIGLQLYTLRNEMAKDPKSVLKQVAALGYREVESFGYAAGKYFGMTPAEFASVLKGYGLAHPSGHYMLTALSGDWNKAIEDAVTAGQQYMVLAYLTDEERKSIDDYKKIAAQMNAAGEACKKAGIQFAYHNHNFEFADMNGQHGYDIFLKETDHDLVKFEFDLYWISFAGKDPVEMFKQHPGRFPLWHVKDMDNTSRKFFTEVGNGVIDFKKIFAASQTAGMKHFFVEQDTCPGPPMVSIEKSIRYLEKNIVK